MTDRFEQNLRRYHAMSQRDFAADRQHLMEAIAQAQASGELPARRRGLRLAGLWTGRSVGSDGERRTAWTRLQKLAPYAAAASLGLAITVWFIAQQPAGEVLSGRVLAALGQVRTMNVDLKTYRGNTLLRDTQVWFERDKGFSQHTNIGDNRYVTVANNEFTWRYTAGGQQVAKTRNYQYVTDPAAFRLEGFDFSTDLDGPARRDAVGDIAQSDGLWRMYVLGDGDETVRVWVDDADLVRAFEHERPRGRASEVTYGQVNYDLPIETTHFEASYPADAVVVAPEGYLEEQFPVADAIYQRQAAGLVFSVHELARLDARTGYMVTSVRLDPETEKLLDDDDPWRYFGDVLDIRPNRGHSVNKSAVTNSALLARMKVGDLIVHWHLLSLAPSKTLEAQSTPFLVRVAAANELKAYARKQGIDPDMTFAAMLPVPGGEVDQTLEQYLRGLHERAQQWSPLTQYFALLEVVPIADGARMTYRWRDPNLFSAGQFIQHNLERSQAGRKDRNK